MQPNEQKEAFSLAWVRLVAANAGIFSTLPEQDKDSVDLYLRETADAGYKTGPALDLQIKCTARTAFGELGLSFPLSIKNYNDLRAAVSVPRLLVVVIVPDEPSNWFERLEDQVRLRECALWVSLRDRPGVGNRASISVTLPKANHFDPIGLRQIMSRIDQGGTS